MAELPDARAYLYAGLPLLHSVSLPEGWGKKACERRKSFCSLLTWQHNRKPKQVREERRVEVNWHGGRLVMTLEGDREGK